MKILLSFLLLFAATNAHAFGSKTLFVPNDFVRGQEDDRQVCRRALYPDTHDVRSAASFNFVDTVYTTPHPNVKLMDAFNHYLAPESLESIYCERLFPNSVEQAFSPGFDIPASALHIPAAEIQQAWSDVIHSATPGSNFAFQDRIRPRLEPGSLGLLGVDDIRPVDSASIDQTKALQLDEWQPLVDFNLQAAKLWESMLDCSHGDAELARDAYKNAKNFCLDPAKDAQMKASLQELHGNVSSFLMSSRLKNLQGVSVIPKLHPLLVQIVFESLSIFESVGGLDRQMVSFVDKSQLSFLIDSNGAGDWAETNVYGLDKANFPYSPEALGLANSLLFLEMVSADRCASWGLWPGASRVVIHSYDTISSGDAGPDGLVDVLKNTIAHKINYACGDIDNEHFNIYGFFGFNMEYGDEFIVQFRKLALEYYQK